MRSIRSANCAVSTSPGKKSFISHGANIKAITLTVIIIKKNAEKIVLMNSFSFSFDIEDFSARNGISTYTDTIEAIATKIMSGRRNAA